MTVCQGTELKIDCLGGQKLEIKRAEFGRTQYGVCKTGPLDIDWNVNCRAPNALNITKKECEGLQSCVLHARISEYGDPCFLVKKYLTVCEQK